MAFLRSLKYQCDLCNKSADVELLSHFAVFVGKYCRKHGEEQLKKYEGSEAKNSDIIKKVARSK